MRHFLFFCLFEILAGLSVSYAQPAQTQGDNSPIVRAQNISMQYGVSPQLVYGLLNVYERDKLNERQRFKEVEQLLKDYDQLRQSGLLSYQFTPEQKGRLGIAQNQPLENLLEWNTFLTTGNYSPILIARGDIEVAYGMPEKVFE